MRWKSGDQEVGTFDDSIIHGDVSKGLHDFLKKLYPGHNVKVEREWTGIMGYVVSLLLPLLLLLLQLLLKRLWWWSKGLHDILMKLYPGHNVKVEREWTRIMASSQLLLLSLLSFESGACKDNTFYCRHVKVSANKRTWENYIVWCLLR